MKEEEATEEEDEESSEEEDEDEGSEEGDESSGSGRSSHSSLKSVLGSIKKLRHKKHGDKKPEVGETLHCSLHICTVISQV